MLNNLQLFERRFVAISLMNTTRCPKCRNEYSFNYDVAKFEIDFHVKSNRPFLLPCGHNMCENCVHHHRTNLTCSTCLMPIEIRRDETKQFSKFHVRDHFDMNFFLLGELNHWRFYRKDAAVNNSMLMGTTSHSNLSKMPFPDNTNSESSVPVVKCAECDAVPSIGKCRLCRACYCKRCFDNIHKNSRALKAHTLQRFDVEKNNKTDIMRLTKSHFCRRHQRRCDRYCQKCDFICCGECAKNDHQFHNYRKLVDMNQGMEEELNITLENTQLALENIQKGQKSIKAVESQLEEYAMKTLEEISNHFLQLHSFLQNEEKQIMDTFSNLCQESQFKLREANGRLNKYQETLNSIRENLEQFRSSEQKHVYLGHILSKYDQQIEQIPSQIEISKPRHNPFNFEVKYDIRQNIHESISYGFKDPKISILIDNSLYYDSMPSYTDTTTSMASALNATDDTPNSLIKLKIKQKSERNKHNNKTNINKNVNIDAKESKAISDISMSNLTIAATTRNKDEALLHVTEIKSPEHFYVQNINDLQLIRQLSHTYLRYDLSDRMPKSISVGYYYMAYHVTDKQWYRGMLKKILPHDLYKIFLVDFGISMDVPKDRLCDIEEEHLKVPFAAMRCAIFDIMPVGKKWTEVENSLLLELLQNKPARVSIIEKVNNEIWKVDLHTHLSKSVRDTFLYTGLARERPGKFSFQLQAKTKIPTIKIEERLPKTNVHVNEVFAVTILNIVGPEEFYVIRNDLIESKKDLVRDLNEYYNNNEVKIQQIYLGYIQMCCAIIVNDIWYRAIIEDIKDKGYLSVRLADEGRKEIINWRQAYVLAEQFRKKREFAIPCTLAHIEPLQKNNYVYTSEAINLFKQMTKNPHLRMEVVAVAPNAFKVALFICKKNLDTNIAAAMVDSKCGISTGEYSQVKNFIKSTSNQQLPTSLPKENNQKVSGDTLAKPLKRTTIIVTHLISPSEFYIQLASLSLGTKTFHQQIQEAQTQKYGSQEPLQEIREWFKDDHCLVYTKYYSYNTPQLLDEPLKGRCEWYRGIITDITYPPGKEQTFSVFLRDIGVTICSIYSQQLFSIDSQLDRVTNAVYCCHLACIEPAGGETWSQSAIDCFRHYITNAETLSVSMQGKRNPETNSLPIVLWSSKIETTDPLAPCMAKYSNINRNLISKGLAHMVEPLDTKKQFDHIEEMELKNGEITLEEWFNSFSNNAVLKDIEKSEKLPSHLIHNTYNDSKENNEYSMDDHPLIVHLESIDLKETTNKKAPAAWCKTNIIKKTIFTGYPTYIDFESIVYLHDSSDKPLLENITKKITETYGNMPAPSDDYNYIKGQACVAKYHVDKKFYRGIVREDLNAELEWGVYFIDYGNVETVKGKDLRPYAPYPNLPAMANKFMIDGIKPKGDAKKYKESELDQMHILLVTKLVSVRIHSSELEKEIKRCSIHVGSIDAASEFIERGLAEADNKPLISDTTISTTERPINNKKKIRKSRNPVEDYAIFSQDEISLKLRSSAAVVNIEDEIDEDERYLSSSSINIVDEVKSDLQYDHLNEMFDCLTKNANNEEEVEEEQVTCLKPMTEAGTKSSGRNKSPPPKKRMFDDNDYTEMIKELMVFDDAHVVEYLDTGVEDDNDDKDVVHEGEDYSMNYWHNSFNDMRLEENEEINKILDNRILSSGDQDIGSDLDGFFPNETSTVMSHISGIESFRPPQLPTAMHHFNCRVISIITPIILQIFPLHLEFRYRDVELQNLIKDMIKQLPPLISFEPSTLCLACYSKDKTWYRAIIRSYNPNAKTVDVLYVDYLNSETLPLKYIRQCPKELLGWPLRTFRVRLHGIKVNPNVKENEICLSLHRLLTKRDLFTVIKKHPNYNSFISDNSFNINNTDLLEIALYETKEDSVKGITVYQSLIEKNYFQRV